MIEAIGRGIEGGELGPVGASWQQRCVAYERGSDADRGGGHAPDEFPFPVGLSTVFGARSCVSGGAAARRCLRQLPATVVAGKIVLGLGLRGQLTAAGAFHRTHG